MGHNVEYKAAIAHVSPVFLNTAATVSKACSIIEEAARNGAQLVVFPEAYIPAFPLWSALQAPIYNHDFFVRLAHEAIRVPGPELERISRVARTAGVFVSIGFNEGTAASVGCIWNSNVLIGDDGTILNHHRKLVPTFYEKLTWANGDVDGPGRTGPYRYLSATLAHPRPRPGWKLRSGRCYPDSGCRSLLRGQMLHPGCGWLPR